MIVDNRGQSRFFCFKPPFRPNFQTWIFEPEPDLNPLNSIEPDRIRWKLVFLILFQHYSVSRFHFDEEILNFRRLRNSKIIDNVYNLIPDIKSRDTMEFHRPHHPQTQPPRPICPNCDVVCCDPPRHTDLKKVVNYSQF